MPANDVILFAQWEENTESVKTENLGELGNNNKLPKTGDSIDILAFSIFLSGILFMLVALSIKRRVH